MSEFSRIKGLETLLFGKKAVLRRLMSPAPGSPMMQPMKKFLPCLICSNRDFLLRTSTPFTYMRMVVPSKVAATCIHCPIFVGTETLFPPLEM